MSVPPISGVTGSHPAPAVPEPRGVSAALKEARTQLREAVPPDRWDAVLDEISRVQAETSSSLLEAYRIVLAKLAAGWVPRG